ncbi:MAG: NAD-dependent epimerase/dehydratase family protein, partial [Bacteroidota bacterium]
MILLTGATGFLGQYMIDALLASGYEVRVLVRDAEQRTLPSWSKLVEVVSGDILDTLVVRKALEGVETVIHGAAMVSFAKRDRDKLMQINVEGTANLIDACLEVGQPRFIQVSSIATIGRTQDDSLADEETPWLQSQAQSDYALSKYKAEREVYRGIAEGLTAVMVNP